MGRGAWRATVHGVTRVRHGWVTKLQQAWFTGHRPELHRLVHNKAFSGCFPSCWFWGILLSVICLFLVQLFSCGFVLKIDLCGYSMMCPSFATFFNPPFWAVNTREEWHPTHQKECAFVISSHHTVDGCGSWFPMGFFGVWINSVSHLARLSFTPESVFGRVSGKGRVSSLLLQGLKNQSGVELLLSPLGSGILLNDLKKENH